MSPIAWVLTVPLLLLVAVLGIYVAARVVFAAYFRSKTDHYQRSQYGRAQKHP